MFFRKKGSAQRFYLLPGQGGRNYYAKQRRLIAWAVVVSLVFGSILAAIMWYVSRPKF